MRLSELELQVARAPEFRLHGTGAEQGMCCLKSWMPQARQQQSKLACFAGGDHPPVLVYSHAVIDVHVPAWRQRRDVGYGPFRIVKGDHHVRRTDSLLQTTIPEKAIAE